MDNKLIQNQFNSSYDTNINTNTNTNITIDTTIDNNKNNSNINTNTNTNTKNDEMTCLQHSLPHIILICINLIFSGWHIIGSLALGNGVNPLIFALYREIFASILMICIIYYKNNYILDNIGIDLMPIIPRVDYIRFLWLGLSILANSVGTLCNPLYRYLLL